MEEKKLRDLIINASKSDYYEKRLSEFVNRNCKIEELPITLKEQLREADTFSMISKDVKKLYDYHESFGTTGQPVSTWFTEKDFDAYVNQINESDVNFNETDRVMIRFPYAISVPAHTFTKAVHLKGGCIIPASRASLVSPATRIINLLLKLKVTVLTCNVLEAFELSLVAKKMGLNTKEDFPNLRAICVAGEMLSNQRKIRLELLWNTKVYNFYGTTEVGNLATSCEEGHLHCSKDFIFEVLDENTNKQVKENEQGILHITTLNKEAFPLLRYNLGDIVQIVKSKCMCGKKSDILIHHGRHGDILEYGGIRVTMRDFQDALLKLPTKIISNEWKIKKEKEGIIIYVENRNYKDMDEKLHINIDIPHRIVFVDEGALCDIDKLLEVNKVTKPMYFI